MLQRSGSCYRFRTRSRRLSPALVRASSIPETCDDQAEKDNRLQSSEAIYRDRGSLVSRRD
jgi:hypothetical protein